MTMKLDDLPSGVLQGMDGALQIPANVKEASKMMRRDLSFTDPGFGIDAAIAAALDAASDKAEFIQHIDFIVGQLTIFRDNVKGAS